MVRDFQSGNLDWIVNRHVLQQLERNAMREVLEPAIALTVSNDIRRAFLADWHSGGTPQFSAVLVVKIDHLSWRITHGIIRPGGDVVLLTIERPGIAAALDRGLKAEGTVADDVDPGRGRPLSLFEARQVFPSVVGETAETVEKLKHRSRENGLRRRARRQASRRRGRCLGSRHSTDLLAEAPAITNEHRSGGGLEQVAHLDQDQVGAQDEDGSLHNFFRRFGPRLMRLNQRLEADLKILGVGRDFFIQNHEINGQLLHSPILVGEEYLANDPQFAGFRDADQDDWRIPGDPLGPKQGCRAAALFEYVGARTQRWVGIEYRTGEALKEMCFIGVDPEVTQLRLCLG